MLTTPLILDHDSLIDDDANAIANANTATVPSSRLPTEALQRFSLFISNEEGFAIASSPF